MTRLRVAAVQMNAALDKAANLAKAESLVGAAARDGAKLVVLPELFSQYGDLAQVAAEAEPLNGATPRQMQSWARQHHIWLIGSFAARHTPGNGARNLAVAINPEGQMVAQYAKIHLFDVDLPPRVTVRESDHFQPGDDVVTCSLGWTTAGLAICYDLRFPELFRALIDQGAQLLVVPSAFTRTTGADHWELLVRARAVESQAFVVAANQVGQHSANSASFGHSLIVDPWGVVLAKGDGERECVLHAELDRDIIEATRARLPALRHRRLPSSNA